MGIYSNYATAGLIVFFIVLAAILIEAGYAYYFYLTLGTVVFYRGLVLFPFPVQGAEPPLGRLFGCTSLPCFEHYLFSFFIKHVLRECAHFCKCFADEFEAASAWLINSNSARRRHNYAHPTTLLCVAQRVRSVHYPALNCLAKSFSISDRKSKAASSS